MSGRDKEGGVMLKQTLEGERRGRDSVVYMARKSEKKI